MAKNISLLGADYPDVPAVQLPQTGGGSATFYDINVVDNLNSTSATDALSAKQGKVLNDNMFDLSRISKTSIAAGTSETISVTNTHVYLIVSTGSDVARHMFGTMYGRNASSAPVFNLIYKGSDITVAGVNGGIQVTNGNSSLGLSVYLIDITK